MNRLQRLLPVILTTVCFGCAETLLIKSPGILIPERLKSARKERVMRILCLWEAAEGQGLDQKPTRGFAGQILFFGNSDPSPMCVHGTIRIYEYDQFDPDDADSEPIHMFIFDDAAWNVHRIESTVGESYNVFLPYVQKHNDLAFCGLRVEFIPDGGRPVSSAMTEITLEPRYRRSRRKSAVRRSVAPGKTAPSVDQQQQQSTQNASRDDAGSLGTLTITLPQS